MKHCKRRVSRRYRKNGTSERGAVNAISGERGVLKNPSGNRSDVRSPTSTRTEVRSPTSTRTEVRSPTSTSTSTRADTRGNFTVTGGAGSGNTTINVRKNPSGKKRSMRRPARKSRRTYRRNPSRTVADPHGARELALCYDNERAVQGQKESIINNLARKMARGQYSAVKAVKLWSYAAKAGADMYAKQFGSPGDTGSSMFNAATRLKAATIMEDENREYVKERSERFVPKAKVKRTKTNPSRKANRSHRRNPEPSQKGGVIFSIMHPALNSDYGIRLKAKTALGALREAKKIARSEGLRGAHIHAYHVSSGERSKRKL